MDPLEKLLLTTLRAEAKGTSVCLKPKQQVDLDLFDRHAQELIAKYDAQEVNGIGSMCWIEVPPRQDREERFINFSSEQSATRFYEQVNADLACSYTAYFKEGAVGLAQFTMQGRI